MHGGGGLRGGDRQQWLQQGLRTPKCPGAKQEENALWKHCLVAHAGERVDFSMEVVGNFHSCLVRQVNEGVRIKRSKAELMNSKAEFHQHPVVRVVPTRGLQNEPGELAGGRRGGGQ